MNTNAGLFTPERANNPKQPRSSRYERTASERPLNDRQFQCPICQGRTFKLRAIFQRHLASHHFPRSTYHCPAPGCGMSMNRLDAISSHLVTTHLRRPNSDDVSQLPRDLPCPSVCPICNTKVEKWWGFYKCFISHCEIGTAYDGQSTDGSNNEDDRSEI